MTLSALEVLTRLHAWAEAQKPIAPRTAIAHAVEAKLCAVQSQVRQLQAECLALQAEDEDHDDLAA